MEVTTVSPSPASLTEGDDLCDTDVSNVAIHSVTLLICLCGLAGNGAVLRLLSLKAGSFSILHLALSDFLVLLFAVPSIVLFLVEDVSCSPIIPLTYMSFVFQLSQLSYFWGLFRLMLTSYMVNIVDLCQICCNSNVPFRLWWLVNGAQYWAFFAFFTVIPTLSSLCPSHEQGHCRATLLSMYIIVLLLFAAPMVIINTLDIIRARRGSRKQPPKRRDVVISCILLLTLHLNFCNFLQQLGYILVSTQVVFLLNCIHSSIKPFIYFLAGRCWSPWSTESLQLSLQRLFEEEEENPACRDHAPRDTVI